MGCLVCLRVVIFFIFCGTRSNTYMDEVAHDMGQEEAGKVRRILLFFRGMSSRAEVSRTRAEKRAHSRTCACFARSYLGKRFAKYVQTYIKNKKYIHR